MATRSATEPSTNVWAVVEGPLRRPKLVILPLVVSLTVSVAASFMVSEKYGSSTLILVESEKIPDSFVSQAQPDNTRRRLYTLDQEVKSRTRLERVLEEINPYPESRGGPLSAAVDRMRSAIRIRVRGNDAFGIEYVHSDPVMAMKVADRLTTLFIEESSIARAQQVESASQFIETQLQEARKELEAHEAAVGRFKQKHMGALPEQLNTNLATLQRLQLEHQSVLENLRAAQDRLGALDAKAGTPPPDGASAELRQLRIQLRELRTRYTDEHPDVRTLLTRIEAVEGAVVSVDGSGPGSLLTDTRLDVQKLKARQEDIERQMATIQGSVDRAPRTEQEFANLTRDYTKLRENYLALLNKKLDAQMAEKLEKRWRGERFRVLDPANLPDRPFFPNRWLFATCGLVGGLLGGIGLALGVDLLDRSVRTAGELEDLLGQPVLVTIAHVPGAPAPEVRTWPSWTRRHG